MTSIKNLANAIKTIYCCKPQSISLDETPTDLLGCQTMDSTSEIELMLEIKYDVTGKLGFFCSIWATISWI